MLKAKIHRATVTHSELEYEGSCAIDTTLLKAADVREYEKIYIYNVTNGQRFSTYAISAIADSGIISVNGAAAHKANPSDIIIICSYVQLDAIEIKQHKPSLVYVDALNKIKRTAEIIPDQT